MKRGSLLAECLCFGCSLRHPILLSTTTKSLRNMAPPNAAPCTRSGRPTKPSQKIMYMGEQTVHCSITEYTIPVIKISSRQRRS